MTEDRSPAGRGIRPRLLGWTARRPAVMLRAAFPGAKEVLVVVTRQLALVFLLAFLVVASACKAGRGDACKEDNDCSGSLVCCPATASRGTCEDSCDGTGPRLDASPGDAAADASADAASEASTDAAPSDGALMDAAGDASTDATTTDATSADAASADTGLDAASDAASAPDGGDSGLPDGASAGDAAPDA